MRMKVIGSADAHRFLSQDATVKSAKKPGRKAYPMSEFAHLFSSTRTYL